MLWKPLFCVSLMYAQLESDSGRVLLCNVLFPIWIPRFPENATAGAVGCQNYSKQVLPEIPVQQMCCVTRSLILKQ